MSTPISSPRKTESAGDPPSPRHKLNFTVAGDCGVLSLPLEVKTTLKRSSAGMYTRESSTAQKSSPSLPSARTEKQGSVTAMLLMSLTLRYTGHSSPTVRSFCVCACEWTS
eukprot:2527609-Rhodomonas_salina.1